MKKFKFSLQSVDKYKRTVEKLQMGELRRARESLRELDARRDSFTRALSAAREEREGGLSDGLTAEELLAYDRYFGRIRELYAALAPRIARAEREVAEREAALIRTKNELKAYAKLRDRELAEWRSEAAAEEALAIGERVAFGVAAPGSP
ncbi:MAG: flagellar FliJ family protein [Oscillospiraceae bacterium]|nr:flagellar FliJ family protein [Oscillospiraceae bacterium]